MRGEHLLDGDFCHPICIHPNVFSSLHFSPHVQNFDTPLIVMTRAPIEAITPNSSQLLVETITIPFSYPGIYRMLILHPRLYSVHEGGHLSLFSAAKCKYYQLVSVEHPYPLLARAT